VLCVRVYVGRAAPAEGPLLVDYKEHHTDVSVHFDVELVPGKLAGLAVAAGGLEAKLKLNSKISTGLPAEQLSQLMIRSDLKTKN